MAEALRYNPLEEDILRPLEVEIEGKTYRVGGDSGRVTTEMLADIAEISKANPEDIGALAKMLGILLRVKPETFKTTDFRVLSAVSNWIQTQLMPSGVTAKGKN